MVTSSLVRPLVERRVLERGRLIAEVVVVVAVTAALMWAVWCAVDWSPTARRDPARTLLLGPRMAFGALRLREIPVFDREELAWFLTVAAVGVGFGVTGLSLGGLLRQPGRMAVLESWLWLLGGLRRSSVPALFTAGGVLTNLYLVVGAWIMLGFPGGRLRRPEERWCVAGAAMVAVIGVACEWSLFDPRVAAAHSVLSSSTNLLLIGRDPVLDGVVQLSVGSLVVVLAGVFLILLVQRWRSESLTYRVSFAPVVGATVVTVPIAIWLVLTTGLLGPGFGQTRRWGVWVCVAVMGAVVVSGLEVGRRRFGASLASSVAVATAGCFVLAAVVYFAFPQMRLSAARYLIPSGVVVALGGGHLCYWYLQRRQMSLLREAAGLEGLDVAVRGLRGIVGDPTIELWRWDSTTPGYFDTDGRMRTADRADGSSVCELVHDGVRLGALVCGETALRAQPEVLVSAKAIATSLLERERSLVELGESRRRIVAAGDEQRRRIERDLHDGAQNRILHVMYLIRFAQRADADEQRDVLLAEAADHLARALNDLRDLTHGVYPTELIQGGLRPALTSLAERSPVPVTIIGADGRRLPVEIESAAYFLTAEAVTNANKHAGATGIEVRVDLGPDLLRIVVSDNGSGGALPDGGGGLRGLRDRAEALGGRFALDSPAGQGTAITVTLPIDEGRPR